MTRATLLALLLCTARLAAAPGADSDYGPFLTGSLDRDKAVSERNAAQSTEQNGPHPNAIAAKAVVVRLGGGAAVAFDTDLLRYAAAWTGGFLDLRGTHLTTPKGSTPLAPHGTLRFRTQSVPGADRDGAFRDPRPRPYGPLPPERARYKGLYVHGDRVVFAYRLGDCDVLDTPDYVWGPARTPYFARTLRFGPTRLSHAVLIFEEEAAGSAVTSGSAPAVPGMKVAAEGRRHVLRVEPSDKERTICVLVLRKPPGNQPPQVAAPPAIDPATFTTGGPARDPRPVITKGTLGAGDGAYVVDSLTLPDDNPAKAWVRPSGLDFFSEGRLAVCTLNGDVWVASGVDASLEKLEWRRFASGLYEPLGLRIVDDKVYVLGRDQITRLHDLNNDGAADFYENFNNAAPASANYHGFAMDLDVDSRGNFYYTRSGQRMHPSFPLHGALLRVSRDGSKLDPIAAGFRAANGLCVGPYDLITVSDNQGDWTPTSRISIVRPGGFYGYVPHATAAGGKQRNDYDPPLCWIPTSIDNSSGSQVWATDPRFGPLAGRMFHTSYGKASLMLVMMQTLPDGTRQGGVLPLGFKLDSGVMRARVNPKDGQLYVAGLRGWQTDGARDGTVARVRFTGKPLYLPTDFKAVPGGLDLTFSQPLDPRTAEDPGSFAVEQWNYLWSDKYGSPDFSVKDPTRQGHDEVKVASAKLSPDRKTVHLALPDLKPSMQVKVDVDVDATDGKNIRETMYLTIHRVPQ